MEKTKKSPIPAEQRIGERFGRLHVVGIVRRLVGKQIWPTAFAVCQCDCGVKKEIALSSLRSGACRSCGCLNKESASSRKKHGLRRHVLYAAWLTMRSRCNNPAFRDYKHYGARGIRVCERWNSFDLFVADMGERPGPSFTVERNDVNGPYSPDNCRWATRAEQSRNTRVNHRVIWNGENLVIADWASRFGISFATLSKAIEKHGEQIAFERAHRRQQAKVSSGKKYVRLEKNDG